MSALICENATGQTNPVGVPTNPDIIIEREVYEKVVSELELLDNIRTENELLRREIRQLETDLHLLSGQIGEKEKKLAILSGQIQENLQTTDVLVKELRSQVKLLNIAKKEQKELLRKYQRRRWTQEERRVGLIFVCAVLAMSITIAVSNLTQ